MSRACCPPLVIEPEDIAEAIRRLDATCLRLENDLGVVRRRAAL